MLLLQRLLEPGVHLTGDLGAAPGPHPHDGQHLPDPGHHNREVHHSVSSILQGRVLVELTGNIIYGNHLIKLANSSGPLQYLRISSSSIQRKSLLFWDGISNLE